MRKQCKKCLLPASVPGANIDSEGVCKPCRDFDPSAQNDKEKDRVQFEVNLEKTLRECKGPKDYDCLLSFSGGKDSIYLLYRLVKEYKLRVLAYTLDFDLPAIAWDNIKRTIQQLNVAHIVHKPSDEFYKKMTRYLLTHQKKEGAIETVCYVWAPLRDGGAIRLAHEKQIPLVLVGYSPHQPDPYRLAYEMPRSAIANSDWTPKEMKDCGLFTAQELAEFWNSTHLPGDTVFPRFLAPLHAWKYNQEEVMQSVVTLGLVANKRNANPVFSNFSMNWLFMYSDLLNLGYNPYAPEFAKLIREGKAKRSQWKILAPIVDAMIRYRFGLGKNISKSLQWLDLKPSDLKITKS